MTVTIHENASKIFHKSQIEETKIIDKKGRVICIRKPPFTTRFKILRMVGSQNGNNDAYVSEILALSWISSIDGEPVVLTTEREAEALLQRLDEHGYVSLIEGIIKIRDSENDSANANEDNLIAKK